MKSIEQMSTEELMQLSDDEQVKVFLHGIDDPDGDTESEGKPDLDGKKEEPEVDVKEEPVILARDSKNTIPYSELKAARERERAALLHAKELEEALRSKDQLINDLNAAKKLDDAAGTTEAQQQVLDEYAGEFPELVNDIKPYIESMIQQGISVGIKSFKEEIAKELEPVRQKVEHAEKTAAKIEQESQENDRRAWEQAQDVFFQAEENKEFFSNKVLLEYLDGAVKSVANDPANNRMTYAEILDEAKGRVTSAIEAMHNSISGRKTPVSQDEIKKKAEDVISKVPEKPPFSLSDVPGSTMAHHDESAELANMSNLSRIDKFMSMDADKIESILSKVL